ncbi:RHS repeat-associated core domain-containing protein [Persicobacter diffluens]|uniref:RHS repeat-associated core domain-containing protein n=1 Tax=Persicobacter diffluens TaxID=981 RepID=UPI0030C6E661
MNSHNSSALRNSVKVAGDVKITYQYNSLGHRSKKVAYDLLGNIEKETAYSRDASGKLLSIYSGPASGNLKQVEIPIYGASRLGMLVIGATFEQEQYELKDHLGNIRTILKHPTDSVPSITLGYSDYYPFGLRMARYTNPGYRFGYQGDFAEDDTGENGFNVFEARLYDPVLGRWTTVDPARQYASGYVGMGNDPVNGVDPDGRFQWKTQAYIAAFLMGGGGQVGYAEDLGEYYVGYQTELDGGIQYTRHVDLTLETKFSFDLSIGVQIGEYISGIEGFELNLASWTLQDYEVTADYSFKNGFSNIKSKAIWIGEDTKVKQKISADISLFGIMGGGAELEHSFWHSNPYGTEEMKGSINGSFLGINSKRVYDFNKKSVENVMSAGFGGSAMLGFSVGGEIKIK